MIQLLISGTTLVWVAILVIIVVYNFALTAFALFRSTLDPYGELPFFGYNLFQTFIVILRYGIIGELYEVKSTQCVSLLLSSILFEIEHVQGRFKALLLVCSHWLEQRHGQRMDCMTLCRCLHRISCNWDKEWDLLSPVVLVPIQTRVFLLRLTCSFLTTENEAAL